MCFVASKQPSVIVDGYSFILLESGSVGNSPFETCDLMSMK